MRVSDVAKRLDISVSLVSALLRSGRLEGRRFGMGRGVWRISEEQLEKYLASTEPKPIRQQPTVTGSFKHLNPEKLREAWKK